MTPVEGTSSGSHSGGEGGSGGQGGGNETDCNLPAVSTASPLYDLFVYDDTAAYEISDTTHRHYIPVARRSAVADVTASLQRIPPPIAVHASLAGAAGHPVTNPPGWIHAAHAGVSRWLSMSYSQWPEDLVPQETYFLPLALHQPLDLWFDPRAGTHQSFGAREAIPLPPFQAIAQARCFFDGENPTFTVDEGVLITGSFSRNGAPMVAGTVVAVPSDGSLDGHNWSALSVVGLGDGRFHLRVLPHRDYVLFFAGFDWSTGLGLFHAESLSVRADLEVQVDVTPNLVSGSVSRGGIPVTGGSVHLYPASIPEPVALLGSVLAMGMATPGALVDRSGSFSLQLSDSLASTGAIGYSDGDLPFLQRDVQLASEMHLDIPDQVSLTGALEGGIQGAESAGDLVALEDVAATDVLGAAFGRFTAGEASTVKGFEVVLYPGRSYRIMTAPSTTLGSQLEPLALPVQALGILEADPQKAQTLSIRDRGAWSTLTFAHPDGAPANGSDGLVTVFAADSRTGELIGMAQPDASGTAALLFPSSATALEDYPMIYRDVQSWLTFHYPAGP